MGQVLTLADIDLFAGKLRALVAQAETDRHTILTLRQLVGGSLGAIIGGKLPRALEGASASDDQILSTVKQSKDGVRLGLLQRTLGMNRKALARALKRLRDKGLIKLVGEKRRAAYHAV
jgi:DNA-binding transcriptional ArsR family regulator